jgi:anti-anti-sigma regulatory factor/DNA-directed RNA polymerase subunit RPC12/RpoP
MYAELTVDIEQRNNVSYISLSGSIDEDTNLSKYLDKINAPVAVINTEGVYRINSCGVRDWVYWIEGLEQKGIQIVLVECAVRIMTHVNTMVNFIGSGAIESFYAPYFCSTCDEAKKILLNVKEVLEKRPIKAPEVRCPKCDHLLEFNDIEDYYFSFLSRMDGRLIDTDLRDSIRRDDAPARDSDIASSPTRDFSPPSGPSGIPDSFPSGTGPGVDSSHPSFSALTGRPLPEVQLKKSVRNIRTILVAIIFLLLIAVGFLLFALMKSR